MQTQPRAVGKRPGGSTNRGKSNRPHDPVALALVLPLPAQSLDATRPAHFRMFFSRHLSRLTSTHPALLLGLALGLATGSLRAQSTIYVTQAGTSTVAAFDLVTKQAVAVGSALTTTNFSTAFTMPIATDAAGNVYIGYVNNGDHIAKFNAAGAVVAPFGPGGTITPGLNNIIGAMAVNQAGTQLLVPYNANTNQILAYDTASGSAANGFSAVSQANPTALAFNASGTFFYSSNPSGALQGTTITRYAATGGAGTAITFTSGGFANNGFDNAKGLFFQSDTSMIVVSSSLAFLERYTLNGTVATLDTTFGTNGGVNILGLVGASPTGGIAADASGNLYVVANNNATIGNIAKFSANGTLIDANFITGLSQPQQIAISFAAIPEPSTTALLAAGALALGVLQFRRRRA
jgi:hypothetical protein